LSSPFDDLFPTCWPSGAASLQHLSPFENRLRMVAVGPPSPPLGHLFFVHPCPSIFVFFGLIQGSRRGLRFMSFPNQLWGTHSLSLCFVGDFLCAVCGPFMGRTSLTAGSVSPVTPPWLLHPEQCSFMTCHLRGCDFRPLTLPAVWSEGSFPARPTYKLQIERYLSFTAVVRCPQPSEPTFPLLLRCAAWPRFGTMKMELPAPSPAVSRFLLTCFPPVLRISPDINR